MITRKLAALTGVATALLVAGVATASPVRIDFADDSGAPTPGFNIAPTNMMSTISDSMLIGSSVPNHANGVDFLRISSSTSSVQGSDVLGFIVTLPAMHLTRRVGTDGDGVGVDIYDVSFASGSPLDSPFNGAGNGGGFAIYDRADTGLTTPLLTADLHLLDHSLFLFGGSGSLESSVGLNLTSVVTTALGTPITTLREFATDAVLGANFVAGISSAAGGNQSITQRILAMANIDGSSSGSVSSVVPEPGTLVLLAVGALLASRRKVKNG